MNTSSESPWVLQGPLWVLLGCCWVLLSPPEALIFHRNQANQHQKKNKKMRKPLFSDRNWRQRRNKILGNRYFSHESSKSTSRVLLRPEDIFEFQYRIFYGFLCTGPSDSNTALYQERWPLTSADLRVLRALPHQSIPR